MTLKQVIFFQRGGQGGYGADKALAESLQNALGSGYRLHYPQMLRDESQAEFVPEWLSNMAQAISVCLGDLYLVGHSLGASLLLKYLSEIKMHPNIKGIFLLGTPYWEGEEEWVQPLKLRDNFADGLLPNVPTVFYHCRDDEEIPFSHLLSYKQRIPWAKFREIEMGGHQFNNDLSQVAHDIVTMQ